MKIVGLLFGAAALVAVGVLFLGMLAGLRRETYGACPHSTQGDVFNLFYCPRQ